MRNSTFSPGERELNGLEKKSEEAIARLGPAGKQVPMWVSER